MILFAMPFVGAAQNASTSPGTDASTHRANLNRYCVTCHNDRLETAGLSLEKVPMDQVGETEAVWEKVLRKLRAREMPPAGAPRPDRATYDSLADYLEEELDAYARANPNPGRPALRRLNRTEYSNAIRDLLDVEIDGASFLPADDTMFGFDNIGDVLTLSPLLTEQYLSAARKIRKMALGDPGMQPVFEFYTVSRYLMQEDRVSEDLPFGTRGGIAVRHHFPLDGEYVIQIRLQRNSREYIRGLAEPHFLDVRLDGALVKQFTIGGEKRGQSAGIFSSGSVGDIEQELYERTADEALELRFPASAGTRLVAVAFRKATTVPEEPLHAPHTLYDYAQYKGGGPAVRTVAIGGPYQARGPGETPSRGRIFLCRPAQSEDAEPCAEEILSTLARRAYRRPLTESDIETLLGFFRQGRNQGGFDEGIGMALERMLAGPEFLFRIERDPENAAPGEVYPVSDLELASRLSFFLWSSIPDDELWALAEQGRLRDPQVLEQQMQRMLGDSRSRALVTNFGSQWLTLRKLAGAAPDGEIFPYFDENLREAFRRETELFFAAVLHGDRSILELLDADYTFVNERLARHYEIPGIYGSHFRRVSLSETNRGGLLGQGSILTVTSYANRTSPVIRGKWILENILGAPPPPPPPNVPALRERNDKGEVLSMRRRMEQHRANPVCASCHKVMDPLGFALENYDAIGKWRTTDARSPIDSTGVMPDGTSFQGPAGLRKILLENRRDDFVLTVAEKLLTYALGRGLDSSDAPALRSILREAAPGGYRFSSLILAIAQSTPFQMRRAYEP